MLYLSKKIHVEGEYLFKNFEVTVHVFIQCINWS